MSPSARVAAKSTAVPAYGPYAQFVALAATSTGSAR